MIPAELSLFSFCIYYLLEKSSFKFSSYLWEKGPYSKGMCQAVPADHLGAQDRCSDIQLFNQGCWSRAFCVFPP